MSEAIGYAVLNVETDVFIKLGQHGPHVVDRDTAERRAREANHFAVVAVTEAI